MQIVVNVPERLPNDILQPLIRQFEITLQHAAQTWRQTQPRPSKWARIAQEAHQESPLRGLSNDVLACSQEIREHFAFAHDEKQ